MEKYKQELNNLKIEYQDKIKLEKDISFGTEIEFEGISITEMYTYINNNINKINNNYSYDYKNWDVDDEPTVEKKVNGKILGAELVSPIFHNDIESWKSLKKITQCFEIPGLYLSDNCSFHVHFGEKSFSHFKGYLSQTPQKLCSSKFISNLFKMWMVFEDIIYKTCYGTKEIERPKIMQHARPSGYYIYNNLDRLYDEEKITQFVNEYAYYRNHGLNLCNLENETNKKTIEIRCPNSMENEILMQNTIRFLARLLQYCDSNNYDNKKIENYIKKYNSMRITDFREEKFEKAKDLADMIYDDELDKMYFLKQYLKCFTQEELIAKQKRL